VLRLLPIRATLHCDDLATMSDSRAAWLDALRRLRCHTDGPAGGEFWCPEYDAMPREGLHRLQSEKLRLAVHYMNDHSPLFARKLRESGI
jgi:hypothetical protein